MAANPVLSWDVNQVSEWLQKRNLSDYCQLFLENDVNGEVLLELDHEILKELMITSVGKRVLILKAVKELKGPEPVAPPPTPVEPSPKVEAVPSMALVNLENSLKTKDAVILDLQKQLESVKENLVHIQQNYDNETKLQKKDSKLQKKDSKSQKKEAPKGILKSTDSQASSKGKNRSLMFSVRERLGSLSEKRPRVQSKGESGVIRIYGNTLNEFENYKTFATTVTETCQQILQIALKKFGIKGNWTMYTLFLHFKGKERSVRYNEIPLLLKRSLRDSTSEEPRFSLRHIRQYDDGESIHSNARESKLMKPPQDLKIVTTEKQQELEKELGEDVLPHVAVGIYEYVAILGDEVSVGIGDSFKVLRRATGWFYVQKGNQFGWAPSGCLDIEEKDDEALEFRPCEGDVLYDYVAEGANELTIEKGDRLLICNRHQHWLLAEVGGQRGWVPSCYVSIEADENNWNKSNFPQKQGGRNSDLDSPRPSLDRENLTEEEEDPMEEEDPAEEEEEDRAAASGSLEKKIQQGRRSVQRLSTTIDNISRSSLEESSEVRQTIKKLLEDIDKDLGSLPTESSTGEHSENIQTRISTMMQELEVLEKKCRTLSIPSVAGQSLTVISRLQEFSNLSVGEPANEESTSPEDEAPGSLLPVTVKSVKHQANIQPVAEEIAAEAATVQEWKPESSPPEPQSAPKSPDDQAKKESPVGSPPRSHEKGDKGSKSVSSKPSAEHSNEELLQKMKMIGRRNLTEEVQQ